MSLYATYPYKDFGKFQFYTAPLVPLVFSALFGTFCDLIRNEEFRATVEIFLQNVTKLRENTGGTIRTIIVLVRVRKSGKFTIYSLVRQ